MNDYLVTIVVMIYKNCDLLKNTINSILDQDYKHVELIISDDASPNITLAELNAFEIMCSSIPNVIIRKNKENMGTVRHFNEIIKMSKGDIICPLSCGDVFYNSTILTKIVNCFKYNDTLICTAKREENIEGKRGRILPSNYQMNLLNNPHKAFSYILNNGNFIGGATTYYSREIFVKYGYFDETYRLVEDLPFFLKILSKNVNITPLVFTSIKYDMSGVSSSGGRNPILDVDYLKLNKTLLNDKNLKLSFMNKRVLQYEIDKMEKKYSNLFLHFIYIDRVILYIIHTIRLRYNIHKEEINCEKY